MIPCCSCDQLNTILSPWHQYEMINKYQQLITFVWRQIFAVHLFTEKKIIRICWSNQRMFCRMYNLYSIICATQICIFESFVNFHHKYEYEYEYFFSVFICALVVVFSTKLKWAHANDTHIVRFESIECKMRPIYLFNSHFKDAYLRKHEHVPLPCFRWILSFRAIF